MASSTGNGKLGLLVRFVFEEKALKQKGFVTFWAI